MAGPDLGSVPFGTRVTLRHRVGERDGRPLYSDAVGELADAGPDAVLVKTRRGPVRVARSAVAAVRAVPPALPKRASLAAIARLEGLCADAWPASVDQPLGAWRLRAAGGFTGRANSALVLGDPGMPVPAALARVADFAAEHGIRPRVQVPVGTPWDRAIGRAGWVLDREHAAGPEVAVLVAPVGAGAPGRTGSETHDRSSASAHPPTVRAPSDVRGWMESARTTAFGPSRPAATGRAHPTGETASAPDAAARTPRTAAGSVELPDRPDPAWWTLALGRDPNPAERGVLDPTAAGRGAPPLAFALLRGRDGAPLAQARGALVADHLHVARLAVTPSARRRGLAGAVMAALTGWATERGAGWVVLQVAVGNPAAHRLYTGLGYREHHRYHYLVPSRTTLS